MKKIVFFIVLFFAPLIFNHTAVSHARMASDSFAIPSAVISGGSHSSTLGEPVIGRSTGGDYRNCAGFWCIAEVLNSSPWVLFLPGLNLFGFPVDVPTAPHHFTALDLLAEITEAGEQGEVQKYIGGSFQVARTGDLTDFDLADGEGYYVYVDQPKSIQFTGSRSCPVADIQLEAGLNLLSFPCAPAGYTSHDLFAQIGEGLASIQGFNKNTGKLETMADDGSGGPLGIIFPIRRGEAYLVYMTTGKTVEAP